MVVAIALPHLRRVPSRLLVIAVCSLMLPSTPSVSADIQDSDDPRPDTTPLPSEQAAPAEPDQISSKSADPSMRSGPPDTTPYTRPIGPEDLAPLGKPAIPPGIEVPPPDRTLSEQTAKNRDCEGSR